MFNSIITLRSFLSYKSEYILIDNTLDKKNAEGDGLSVFNIRELQSV